MLDIARLGDGEVMVKLKRTRGSVSRTVPRLNPLCSANFRIRQNIRFNICRFPIFLVAKFLRPFGSRLTKFERGNSAERKIRQIRHQIKKEGVSKNRHALFFCLPDCRQNIYM